MRRRVAAVAGLTALVVSVALAMPAAQAPAVPPPGGGAAPAAPPAPPPPPVAPSPGEEPATIVKVHHEPHHRQVFQHGPMRILDLQLPPGRHVLVPHARLAGLLPDADLVADADAESRDGVRCAPCRPGTRRGRSGRTAPQVRPAAAAAAGPGAPGAPPRQPADRAAAAHLPEVAVRRSACRARRPTSSNRSRTGCRTSATASSARWSSSTRPHGDDTVTPAGRWFYRHARVHQPLVPGLPHRARAGRADRRPPASRAGRHPAGDGRQGRRCGRDRPGNSTSPASGRSSTPAIRMPSSTRDPIASS